MWNSVEVRSSHGHVMLHEHLSRQDLNTKIRMTPLLSKWFLYFTTHKKVHQYQSQFLCTHNLVFTCGSWANKGLEIFPLVLTLPLMQWRSFSLYFIVFAFAYKM
jgi:hypothetical protein